jgi:hypothetical protein
MQFFYGLSTEEEIKARFKDLAKQYHPDLGGCVETMKEINNQYDKALTCIHERSGKSITEIEDLLRESIEVRNKLSEIIKIPGIFVEVCGNWIWVTGETKIAKELLKSAGFMWASKKLAWYWRRKEDCYRRFKHESWSLDRIREKHGSQFVNKMNKTHAIA